MGRTIISAALLNPKVIPLNKTVSDLLLLKSKLVNISGYVFSTMNGTKISRWNLKREFDNALRKAGITDFRFHDLRHTFATRLCSQGLICIGWQNFWGTETSQQLSDMRIIARKVCVQAWRYWISVTNVLQ